MAEGKSKKQPPKIADITKPGKAAPSSNAHPMIITHRPVLKDPMIVQDGANEETNDETDVKPVTHMSHSIKLQPLHDDVQPEESSADEPLTPGAPGVSKGKTIAVLAEEAAKRKAAKEKNAKDETANETDDTTGAAAGPAVMAEPTGAPAVETDQLAVVKEDPVTETAEPETEPEEPDIAQREPKQAEAKPDETKKPAVSEEKPVTEIPEETPAKIPEETPAETIAEPGPPKDDDGAKPAGNDNSGGTNLSEADQRAANEAKKVAEEQEKIITSGKYYLPINAVAKRRSKQHVMLGLVLILLLAAALFLAAWDAGLFSIPGYAAPTDYL
ncbi:MAG TPA: hypothetical protein VFL85_01040 [Candidatus Saccharimonadales bacterium]|nr:hypothetical protein [Candidatus Saccharimonadales bacterium]